MGVIICFICPIVAFGLVLFIIESIEEWLERRRNGE